MDQVDKNTQIEFQKQLEVLQKGHKIIQKCVSARQKLDSQLNENTLVLKELELLESDANVFKLTGPVLVKQDLDEAISNVKKRVEYITAEIKRQDTTLADQKEKQDTAKQVLTKIQSTLPVPNKA